MYKEQDMTDVKQLPEAFLKEMEQLLGDEYEAYIKSYEEAWKPGLRVNTLKIMPEEFKNLSHLELTPVDWTEKGFYYEDTERPARHPFYYAGLYYLQEPSAMAPAAVLPVEPGDKVLDVCAAPGGKSTHMAELLQGSGMVEARDLTEYKVDLIRENIARHGLSNMKAVQMDATVDDPDSHQKADVLVCDLPCSGLGVMGKKTDIRYKMTKEKAAELAKLQRQILSVVWDYVRPGGTLVYSTCTIHRSENEDNTAWFLKEHPEFSLEFQRQIFPGEAGSDGFFLAKLVRSK